MFKNKTYSKMKDIVDFYIANNRETIQRHKVNVVVETKRFSKNLFLDNEVMYIVEYTALVSYKQRIAAKEIIDLTKITFCMNSIYKIAKANKQDPIDATRVMMVKLLSGLSKDTYVEPQRIARDKKDRTDIISKLIQAHR